MPAGSVTVLDVALEKLGGALNLETDVWHVVLCTSDQALGAAFVGTSGQALYSDLTDEAIGTGYATGGEPLDNPSWSLAGSIATFDADPVTWTALTATVKYAVICRSDAGSPPALSDILAVVDLETGDPDGRVSAGADFIINWGASGLFTLTRV